MRTVVLSDLHLGNGQGYDIFAGAQALPAFLDALTREPTRVVLNGDSVDFLMNEDPMELQVERAVDQARAMVASAPTAAVLEALGRVLAAGGEGVLRLGNHDVELALAEVQEVQLLNPLERQYGMRFTDLLMPGFQGALLAALAVNPGAVRLASQGASLNIGWQWLRRSLAPVTFDSEQDGLELGLAERVKAAGLTLDEQQALEEVMGAGLIHFSDEDPALRSARQKLGRSALEAYARVHRLAAGDASTRRACCMPTLAPGSG